MLILDSDCCHIYSFLFYDGASYYSVVGFASHVVESMLKAFLEICCVFQLVEPLMQ